MEAYKKWVRRNKDYLHSLESLANGLTWLLPERFADSEIGPEAVSALLGLITIVNDHIIGTTPSHMPLSSMGPPPPPSFPWSFCISVIKDLETLVEVAAQQLYGDDRKWDFIAITEATKVLVRLALLRDGGYKMLLQGGETLNVQEDPNSSNTQHRSGGFTKAGEQHKQNPHNLEGRALFALSKFGENRRMVCDPTRLNRLQHLPSQKVEPSTSVKRPTLATIWSEKGIFGGLFVTAEVLHITRPLIYVVLIRKYGVRSWIPWVVSLAVDLTGMSILSHVTHPGRRRTDGMNVLLSTLEKNEIKRRKLLWAFYLMRDPFFSKYTRQRIENTTKLLEPVAVVGFLIGKVMELVVGAQARYTYMSGS